MGTGVYAIAVSRLSHGLNGTVTYESPWSALKVYLTQVGQEARRQQCRAQKCGAQKSTHPTELLQRTQHLSPPHATSTESPKQKGWLSLSQPHPPRYPAPHARQVHTSWAPHSRQAPLS